MRKLVKLNRFMADSFLMWKLENLYSSHQKKVGTSEFNLDAPAIKDELNEFMSQISDNSRLYYDNPNIGLVGLYVDTEEFTKWQSDFSYR
jgi:hypothetical protein